MNFDFNGDTVMPEQDNLFDDLLEDLAFESELGNFDGNFLGKPVIPQIWFNSSI